VKEAVQFLTGEYRNPRLLEITLASCVEMLVLAGLADNDQDAEVKLMEALDNGKAAQCFGKMVSGLGGQLDFVENYANYLEQAEIIRPVFALEAGLVSAMDTRAIGMAVVGMGGGRKVASDQIDYAVGFDQFIQLGEMASSDKPLATIHARNEAQWQEAARALQAAITIGGHYEPTPSVYRKIRAEDI
jgi:thymidine phosphorylase